MIEVQARGSRTTAVQLRDSVLQLVSERRLQVGDKLPTEAELGELFKASRPTVREALKLLEQSGVIRVQHGRGRFLTAAGSVQVDRPITEFESITDMAKHSGYVLENKVLSISEDTAPKEIATSLSIAKDEPIIRLERLRLHDGEPVVYCLEHIRRDAIEDRLYDIDWSGSLLNVLERYRNRPIMSSAKVSAVALPDDVVRRNELSDFGPALKIEEVAFSEAGTPVLHAMDYHRGSHFAFSFLRK